MVKVSLSPFSLFSDVALSCFPLFFLSLTRSILLLLLPWQLPAAAVFCFHGDRCSNFQRGEDGKQREKRLKGEKNRVMSGRKLHPLIEAIKSKHHGAYDPLSADVIQLFS